MWSKYERIARDLRERITDGTYAPGSALPAIPELMTTYGVARETVRNAIAALANEGLVTPRSGVGTIVRDTGTVNLHSKPTDPHPVWDATVGDDSKTVTVEAGHGVADEEIAALLNIAAGDPVVRRIRHYYKGRDVVLLHEQWISGPVAAAILEHTSYDTADAAAEQPTDLYSLMRDSGCSPAQTTEVVTTRMPDPEEKETMNMPAGIPVLVTIRTTHDQQQQALETSSFVACGDRAEQTYTVQVAK
jgi:DNA-binding GntR family transcriptional regulator